MSDPGRRHLLLFSFDYPPLTGGIARLTSDLARELARRGEPVSVLTGAASGDGRLPGATAAPEVRLERRRPLLEAAAWRRLRRERRRQLVLCGVWNPEGLIASLAGARPRVILAHGAELLDGGAGPRAALRRRLRRRVLESADLVVANSEYTRKLISRAAPRSRAVTVLPGVDPARFSPNERRDTGPAGKLVISSVSRIFAYKGHEVVFRALAGLPDGLRRRFVFRIAGTGPDERRLSARAEALGLRDLVEWHGYVREEDLTAFYRASDLFVLCSCEEPAARRVEGLGLALLEAQACGVPVVGSRSGGVPEAVREAAGGWLIEPDDDAALGRLLLRLIDDPEALRRAGREARRRVEADFTLGHYVERLRSALLAANLPA